MFRLFGYGIALALLVTSAVWLADHAGTVRIDWLDWRITTNMPVLLAILLVTAGLIFTALRLFTALMRWPSTLRSKRLAKQRHKGYQALSDGLAAVASGQIKQARKLAGRAEKLLKDPHLTRLLTVQTAELTGDDSVKQHYEEMRARPETALLGLRGLLDLALAAGDRDQAIELAQQARALAPTDPDLAEKLFTLLVARQQWAEAQDLVIEAGRRKAMSRERVARRRALILNERARRAEDDGDIADAIGFARQAVGYDAGLVDAALRLSRLQQAQDLVRQATSALEKSWRHAPHPAVAAAYAKLGANQDPLQRLRRLEKLAAMHPDAWTTHRVMGEAALDAKLWGQARKHLTAALPIPTAGLLGLLAKLELGEYKNQKAAQSWMATMPVADPAWTCGACGGACADWSLSCPRCGAIDQLSWPALTAAASPHPAPETA